MKVRTAKRTALTGYLHVYGTYRLAREAELAPTALQDKEELEQVHQIQLFPRDPNEARIRSLHPA